MPQFTMFLQCNEKPKLNKLDNAILRRLKVINFPNVFKMNPDPSNKFEKQADTDLKDKINDDFAIAFLMLLFDYAMEHKDKKEIEMPSDCKDETTKYINENNVFGDWFNSNLIEIDDKSIFIKCKDLKDTFNRCIDDIDKIKSVSDLIKKLSYNNIKVNIYEGLQILRGYKIKEQETFINGLDN
jgi:phage/plasmid-associated DNA primase